MNSILHTSSPVASLYRRIKAELERAGKRVDDADLLIAAIALEHDAILVTNNTRHFERIPGLSVENWLKR